MKRVVVLAAVLSVLVLNGPAAAQQIGCFSDGDFVYLHVGSTYQYYLDRGEQPVNCTPDAVALGLELTEEAVQTFCADGDSTLCQEKQQYAALIRETYGDLLQAAAAPAAGTGATAGQAAPAAPAEPTEVPEPAEQAAAAEPELPLKSPDTIRWVQESLTQLGYDPGGIDGAMGRRTAAAIKRYEQDNGMAVSGKMSQALVASLRQQVGPP